MKRLCALCIVTLLLVNSSVAEEPAAEFAGSKTTVPVLRHEQTLLLDSGQLAKAAGWDAKLVTPGQLLTLCQDGPEGSCVPIRLDLVKWRQVDETLFVEAKPMADALGLQIDDLAGRVFLRRATRTVAPSESAYNASWGKNRGFRQGQTLPDIPLYDMQGKEVRFSQFLGKQYIIYCWASW